MIYQTFAQLYDELFDDQLYADWQSFVMREVQAPGTLLDLAGGAGRLAVRLAKQGFSVTDADLSVEMLSLADQHAQSAQVDLALVEADMLDLTGLGQFQTITCFADSLCYLNDLAQVNAALTQAGQHLAPGGKFLFDVITPYQTDQVYPGYPFNYQDEDHTRAFMWQSFADEEVAHGVIHDLTFFIQQGDGSYRRLSETHFERTYPLADYLTALKVAGFDQVQVSADFGRHEVKDDTTRWFFVCQKGGTIK